MLNFNVKSQTIDTFNRHKDIHKFALSKEKFDSIVNLGNKMMEKNEDINLDEALVFVKAYNTICVEEMYRKRGKYSTFMELFQKVYTLKCVKLLDASLSRGMSYYSKKYNIYIGVALLVDRENSIYFIE